MHVYTYIYTQERADRMHAGVQKVNVEVEKQKASFAALKSKNALAREQRRASLLVSPQTSPIYLQKSPKTSYFCKRAVYISAKEPHNFHKRLYFRKIAIRISVSPIQEPPKALHICKRARYFRRHALYIRKTALCTRKTALYICKRALHIRKTALYVRTSAL